MMVAMTASEKEVLVRRNHQPNRWMLSTMARRGMIHVSPVNTRQNPAAAATVASARIPVVRG